MIIVNKNNKYYLSTLPGDAITAAQPLAFGEVTEPWFLLLNLFKELARLKLLDLVILGSGGKLFNLSSFTWDFNFVKKKWVANSWSSFFQSLHICPRWKALNFTIDPFFCSLLDNSVLFGMCWASVHNQAGT